MPFLQPADEPSEAIGQLSDWLAADEAPPLLIQTSGSTGVPKRVILPRPAVLASVAASAARVGTGRWLLALPPSYVAGVQVIVRSLVAGHRPVVVESFARQAREGDCTSLVPTQLHRLLDDAADTAALARARVVLLGGGPIDPGLRERAEAAGIPVVATYGSSETAGGCVYDGHPLDGVAVKIDAGGRILLGGPTIFDGYDGDPELTARTLVDGWFRTNDAGRLDEDGRLQVLGRIDDVVISGGVKVPLPAVSRRLREHPEIDQAEVLGIPDIEWGQRVVAFVVPSRVRGSAWDTTPSALDSVRAWVGDRQPRSWAPRQVVVLEHLPLLDNGKIHRQRLLQILEERS